MCQFYPNLFPPEVDRDERENVLTAASRKRLLDTLARILRIHENTREREKERKQRDNKTHVVARFLLAAGWTSQREAHDIGVASGSPYTQ